MWTDDDRKWLYGQMKDRGYDVGSEETFAEDMDYDEDAEWWYEEAKSQGLDVGRDLNEFIGLMRRKQPDAAAASASSASSGSAGSTPAPSTPSPALTGDGVQDVLDRQLAAANRRSQSQESLFDRVGSAIGNTVDRIRSQSVPAASAVKDSGPAAAEVNRDTDSAPAVHEEGQTADSGRRQSAEGGVVPPVGENSPAWQGIQGKGLFDLNGWNDRQSWFINGKQFDSTAAARMYIEQHPEIRYNFNADGRHFKSFDELVEYQLEKNRAATEDLKQKADETDFGSFDREREATQQLMKAIDRFRQAIKSGNVSNIINLVTGDELKNWEDFRKSRRAEYDKLHYNDAVRSNMDAFFEEQAKAQKEAYRQMEQYSRNAPNSPYAGIARGTQMAKISLTEMDPQKISSDVVKSLDRRGALTNYIIGRMGLKPTEVPSDYNPLGGGGDTLTGAEMNALTMLMYHEHSDMADKIQQDIYDYYKRHDAPDGDLEYILSSAVHDNIWSQIAKALAHRVANDSGLRDQLRDLAFGEYGEKAGFWTQSAATAAPFTVDLLTGGFYLPSQAGKAVVGGVVKGLSKEGAKRLVTRGASKAMAKQAAGRATARWIATEHPYWNIALNALGSGVNFMTFEAQNSAIQALGGADVSFSDFLGSAAKGFLLGGAMGFGGGFVGKMGENMRGWRRLAADAGGFGTEVGIFTASDAATQAMNGEDVDWGKSFGRSLAMVTGFKLGGLPFHAKGMIDRYTSPRFDLKFTDGEKESLQIRNRDELQVFIGEMMPVNADGVKEIATVEKGGAEDKQNVPRSRFDVFMSDNDGSIDTKRKVNYLLTGSPLIQWRGGSPYPYNAWVDENENGTYTMQTFDADGKLNGIAEYTDRSKAEKDFIDTTDLCRYNNINGIRAFCSNAGFDLTIERDAFGRTRDQFGIGEDGVGELEELLSLKKDKEDWTDRDREILDAYLNNFNIVFGERLKEYQAKQAAAAYDSAAAYERAKQAAEREAGRLLTGSNRLLTGAKSVGGEESSVGDETLNGDLEHESVSAEERARRNFGLLMADTENRRKAAEDAMRGLFGNSLMDFMLGGDSPSGWFDPILLLRQALVSGESEENIGKVVDYVNAWYADRGLRDGLNGAVRSEIEKSDAEIDGMKNRQSGLVRTGVMKTDNRQVYVIDGDVVMLDDGSGIDRGKSSESLIVKDAATGKVEVVDPRDLLSVDAGLDAEGWKEQRRKEIEAGAEGLLGAAGEDGEGSEEPGGPEEPVEPGGPAPLGGGFDGPDGPGGEGGGDSGVGAGVDADAMPMTGEGEDAEPDFMQTTPERGYRYLYDESGLDSDEADAFVEANLAEAKKRLDAETKRKPKMGTSLSKYKREKAAYEDKVKGVQAEVDYWNGVKQAGSERAADAERARQEEEARRQEEERRRLEEAREAERRRQEEELRRRQEAEALGGNAVGPAIRARWDGAEKIEGNADELVLADGTRIGGRYVMVESGAATPSHNAGGGFVKNDGFPVDEQGGTVNDRDYERDRRAQDITREMGRTYDSRALQNVPVVSRDGVVLSGNGRTMAGEIAAADGTDGAYIDYLGKFGGKFGFTPEQVSGMQHPRVVFVPDEPLPYNAETFSRFNAQEMKGQNKTETAVKLGKIVPDDVFNRIIRGINEKESISDFFGDDKASAAAVNELRSAGVINEMQYGEMFDGGRLSGSGRELIENVLIGKAFSGSPDAVRMLTEFPAMRQKVVSALTAIGNNRRLGADYTLENELMQAVDLAYNALKSGAYKYGDRVSDYARQQNLFSFDDGATVADYKNMTVMMLADVLNNREVNKLRNVLEIYNAHSAESAAGQMDMFSDGVRSKDEILKDVFNILGYGTKKEIESERRDAHASVRSRLDGEGPGGPGGGVEGSEPSGSAGSVDTGGAVGPVGESGAEPLSGETPPEERETGNGREGTSAEPVTGDQAGDNGAAPRDPRYNEGWDGDYDKWKARRDYLDELERKDQAAAAEGRQAYYIPGVDGYGQRNGVFHKVWLLPDEVERDSHGDPVYGGHRLWTEQEALGSEEGFQLGNVYYNGGELTDKDKNGGKSVSSGSASGVSRPLESSGSVDESAPGYSVTPTTYTNKKGKTSNVWLVKFDNELTKEQLAAGKELAKEPLPGRKTSKGWWSRDDGGFLMRSEESAKELGDKLGNGESVKDAQPLSLSDVADANDQADMKAVDETIKVEQESQTTPQYDYDREDDVYDKTLTGLRNVLNDRKRGAIPNIKSIENVIRDLRKRAKTIEDGMATAAGETIPQAFDALANLNGKRRAYEQFLSDIRKKMAETERDDALAAHGVKLGDVVMYKGKEATIHDADARQVTLDVGLAPVLYEVTDWENVELPKPSEPTGPSEPTERPEPTEPSEPVSGREEPSGVGPGGETPGAGETGGRKSKSKWVDDEDAARFEELRQRLRKKMGGQLNMGIDPEIFAMGAEMAYMMIKHGLHKFADFAREMIDAVGEEIRPYLKSLYEGARNFPETEEYLDKMTPYDEVRKFDVKNFDKKGPKDLLETAEHIVREQASEREAKEATDKLKQERNEQRKETEQEVAANTEALASEAATVASEVESKLPSARSEREVNDLAKDIDNAIDKVNDQLALLGYYEAEPVESDFNEAYGYMRNAEKKAVKNVTELFKTLTKELGISDPVVYDAKGKKQKSVTANIAPAGGDVTMRFMLNRDKGVELYIDFMLAPDYENNRDNLVLKGIMFRPEKNLPNGGRDYLRANNFFPVDVTVPQMLHGIRSVCQEWLPAEDYVAMAQRVAAENAGNQKEKTSKGGKSKKKSVSLQEQTIPDLFSGLFSEEDSNLKPTSNEQEVHVQPRTGTTEREGGHQREQNEPLGESKQNEDERPDAGGVVRRSGNDTKSDTAGGSRLSEPSDGKRNLKPSKPEPAPLAESERKNTHNNHAERGTDYAPKGTSARIEANIKAIETMQRLIESGEPATPEDMSVLRKFSGWGGLGAAFKEKVSSGDSGYNPRLRDDYQPANPINARLRELLSPEAYEAANMSRNTAYYTPAPIIDAMWDVARAMGFRGGNVLEGSAGIGKVLGQMPSDMSERSNIQAIEVDETTGNILKLLYPDAKVDVQGFEKTYIPNGSVDLAITNVPFGDILVKDETGDKDLSKKFHSIHDFCIAKNVRKLKEGGVGIFISTSGTLDSPNSAKLRNWLVNEGNSDVVGAFRMHKDTFGGAGVTSDIIVVRKRVNGRKSANAIDVSGTLPIRTVKYNTGETKRGSSEVIIKDLALDVNKHFVEHPEDMAGEMAFAFEKGNTYRATSKALYPSPSINQEQRLSEWAQQFKDMDWDKAEERESQQVVYEDLGEDVKEGSMLLDSDGNLCLAQRGKAVPINVNSNKVKGHTKAECFNAYKAIKDALADVLEYQTTHSDDSGLQQRLAKLNKAYDSFVNTYGHLNKNTSISFLRNDMDYPSIAALESVSETGDKSGKRIVTYGKTDIFSRRVVETESEPKPTTIKDGIIASIYLNGRVDVPYIAEQLNMSDRDVRQQIIESGLGFENPTTTEMEVSYEYLSGNVREKLRQAEENNTDGRYDANIKALERVIPMNIPAHLIEFTLGSSWVEPKLYEDFVKERTGLDVKLTNAGGTWIMTEPYWTNTEKNKAMGVISEKCDKTIYGHELIKAAITCKSISVTKTVSTGYGSNKTTETIVDKEATMACANKIDEIRQDFKDWARGKMQGDPEMSERMERVYNELFNNSVPKEIPDEFVPDHFGGAATVVNGKPFKLRPHQAKAVIRATTQPLMLAHEVGTGKTYTLISTAMEMRRLGTARKPMIVVQNATVGQFVASAKALYPNAKILTLEDADRNAEGRRNFYAKIRYNDWDMIVVPQSVFERIPDSEERQIRFVEDKVEEKMMVLEKMREASADDRDPVLRQAQRELDQLNDELNDLKLALQERKAGGKTEKDEKREAKTRQNAMVKAQEMLDRETDDVANFDDMGIDALLIDEAHEYKHLGFATAMQRGVKGVDPSYSKKSQGVYLKTQAVLESKNGKNVVFATGTPISNTAAEIWTFMRYLMPADTMREYGIYYFDDFVRNFGNIQQMLEFSTNGKYKENNRFAGYVNLPELVRIWAGVADTVLTREAGGVSDKIPKMDGAKAQDIYLPQTKALRGVMKFVKDQLDEYEKMSGKEKKENSHIPLVMYGIAKAAAVDARLVLEDAADEPNSKTNEAVRQTLRSLEDTKEYNGTVAIFADNYQNKATGFNLYEDIRKKLIDAGVPEAQVVVMKSGMSIKKKLEIFDKVNRGEVRVIMGSTFTLGTGVNIQERLHTLIHVDAPNRPMDYTQRNGRILRQGNLHNEWGIPVRVLRFGVEDSLDVTAYQRLKTKGAIADSIMEGKRMMSNSMENRVLEEEQDLFGDITAQLSGSQYALLKNQVEKEVKKLEARKKQWEADQTYVHNQKPRLKALIKDSEERAKRNKEALSKVEASKNDGITIGKMKFPSLDAMGDYIKDYNSKQREQQEQVRTASGYKAEAKSDLTVSVGGFDFHIHRVISKEQKQEKGQLSLSFFSKTQMTYSCRELGLEDVPVDGQRLKSALEDIVSNVMTGNDFREKAEYAERAAERYKGELQQVEARDGKPFEYADELKQAKEKLAEYEELMKAEMAEKEAKYAEMDASVEAAKGVQLSDEDSDGENISEGDLSFSTSDELDARYPGWLEGQTRDDGRHSTQIPSTVNSYRHIGDWLLRNGMGGVSVLDASSGLGNGTIALREMGFDVDDVEPYPSENRVAPTYLSYDDIDRKYDVVISNAVLNVIPDDWRRNVLHSMASKVKDGGRMIINVRGAGSISKQKQKIELDSPSEILVTDKKGNITAYQRGFTPKELREYVSSELGEGWDVVVANQGNSGLGSGTAVVATRNGGSVVEDSRDDVRSAIEETSSTFGEDVELIEDVSSIKNSDKRLEQRMRNAKGWFNAKTGKVTIVVPNNRSVEEAVGTVLHEVTGHKGLRELFGDDFDTFLDNIYNNVEADIRERIDRLNRKKGGEKDRRDATEEYMSRLAEDGKEFDELKRRGVWQKIKDWFMDLLRKVGVKLKRPLNDNDLRYIIWRSRERMKERAQRKSGKMGADPLTEARDLAVRDELGIDKASARAERGRSENGRGVTGSGIKSENVRFSDGGDVGDSESVERELNGYDAGRMTFDDAVTDGLTKLSAKNKDDKRLRVEAIMAIGGNLSKILQGMSAQREYDRKTVDDIVRLSRTVIGNGMFSGFSPYEVGRLLGMVKRAAGREDITKQADEVVDLLMDRQLKELRVLLDKQLSVRGKKVDGRGVEIQGSLDAEGQRMMDALRGGMKLDADDLDARIADCLDRMGSDDDVTRHNAEQEYAGLMLANEYREKIGGSESEEENLRNEIRQADDERRQKKSSGDKDADSDFREFKRETERAIRENRLQRMAAYGEFITKLGGELAESAGRAKDWLEQEQQRVREIQHNANSDLEGKSASEFSRETWRQRAANWAPVRFFMKPLGTFDTMLRFFGSKSVDGRGYLWNRFMTGWVEANDKEWRNLRAAHDVLDAKVSEVFGKKMRWSDLFSLERKMEGMEVEFWDAGEKKTHKLSQGNMLYIYMVNKMSDGRMKLRKMGISEEDVERITDRIDPRFIELADWMQEDFLKQKRKDYNAVHLRLTGADMADIENYFPLKVNKRSLNKDEDLGSGEVEAKPSTKSVSWIKRTKNSRPLDIVNADAFDVILEHLQDNEHIAAFAELNRDLNTLLSYRRFRNKVLNMSSLRFGSGKSLWNNFRRVCEIAAGVYIPKVDRDSVDTTIVNIAKGVTMGKISFRIYTAFKQLTSSPAFTTEASAGAIARNNPLTGGWRAWNWAMKNLPGFSKRWQSRQAGDSRLIDTDSDWKLWHKQFVRTMSRYGMTPNALIDALTVACGAKAIYDTKVKKYKKMGYDDARAHKLALRDASISVNETQQSSEEAYLSAVQLDRTVASTAITVFRNASMGYQRRYMDAMANFGRKFRPGYRDESIAFMKKQLMRDGLSEEQADAAAKSAYRRSWWKDVANMAVFGHIMQIAWNIAPYLPFLFLIGGDEDKKEEMAEDALLHSLAGPIEGLSFGAQMSEIFNIVRSGNANKQGLKNYQFNLLPLMSDLQTMMRHFTSDQVQGWNDVVNLVVQSGVGVNPQTITDMVGAILDRCDGDPDLSREAAIMWLRIINATQSQLDQVYLEELGLNGSEAKKLSAGELAERYVRYKMRRTTPLTGWAYSDEARQKAEDRYMDRFVKLMDERIEGLDEEQMQQNFDGGDALLRKEIGKRYAKQQGTQDYGGSPKTTYGEIYNRHRNYFDLAEDVLLQTEAKKAKDSGDTERYKEIDSGRKSLTKLKKDLDGAPYTLQDGRVISVDDIMNEIREERLLLLEELGL